MLAPDPYDLVPYEAGSDARTRPGQVAMASWLHGGPCPRVEGKRVLDVGCGTGGNLLPMAFYDPAGQFVGLDRSREQVRAARDTASELGLDNIRFLHEDVRALREDLEGPFDYIIAHALFSWVAAPVRAAVLALCREMLAPDGLLFLSYNVFPGWKTRGAVRDILLHATRSVEDPIQRAEQAMAVAARLRKALPEDDARASARLMAGELDRVIQARPFYVLHEYLAPENHAFYFRDVAKHAANRGLAYVAESSFNQPEGRVPDTYRDPGRDVLEVEQEIDILLFRQFRASIFCRSEAVHPAPPGPDDLDRFFVATLLPSGGEQPEIADPPARALLKHLQSRSPRGLPARKATADVDASLADAEWSERLVELHRYGIAELRLAEPSSPAPGASHPHALARCEARLRPHVTTPYHTAFYPDDEERAFLAGGGKPPPSLDRLLRSGLLQERA